MEERDDVLVYTSDALRSDLELIGPLRVVLHAASDAPDTDFVARLVDAVAVAEGTLRARFREGSVFRVCSSGARFMP